MLVVQCRKCGRDMQTHPSRVAAGKGKYCGVACRKADGDFSRAGRSHGMSRTRLYGIWCHMKNRCGQASSTAWDYYGGRGISVCREWSASFETFRDWAVANGYAEGLELDRKDTNGNYEPDNCRWATLKEQARNKRNNRLITHDGRTQPLAAWSEETGIHVGTILSRIDHLGWSVAQALTTPSRGFGRKKCKS